MSTLLPLITELEIVGVFEPGVPNKERVVLRPRTIVDLGNYALVAAARTPTPGLFAPARDSVIWLGGATLGPNDWLMIYTGPGRGSLSPTEDGKGKIAIGFWGRDRTIFHDPQVVPNVWRLSGILFQPVPPALPQQPM